MGNRRVGTRTGLRLILLAVVAAMTGCITTQPRSFQTFLLPASPHPVQDQVLPEPPAVDFYANETPNLAPSLPAIPRPSDSDFLLKAAQDHFDAGRRAVEESRLNDARREFDQAVETLLNAPDDISERARIEQRLDQMVDAIYHYDLDQLGAGVSDDQAAADKYDKSPLDGIIDLTFPVDPALRSKVSEQIRATVSQLPLEESDSVLSYINFFSTERGKRVLAAGLRRQGRYKPMIERILAEEGLPQELIFIAQAESGFLPRAVSNKQCVGMWQFAKFRGHEYGLMQTLSTDDRLDPEKATRAAAHHLHDLYRHLGDWYLALAAYDCGPGCIDHAVMRTGYADFWKLRELNVLPHETANYVPVILAMIIVSKNAKDYGLDDIEPEPGLEYDTIELQTATHLALVADSVDRPLSVVKELNPAVLKSVAPAGYSLRIPKGTTPTLAQAFAEIPPNHRDSWRLCRVLPGESFGALAKRFGTATNLVSSANHDLMPEVGEFAVIPVPYPGDRVTKPGLKGPAPKRRTVAAHASGQAPAKAPASAKGTPSHASPARTSKSVAAAHRKAPAATHHAAKVSRPSGTPSGPGI